MRCMSNGRSEQIMKINNTIKTVVNNELCSGCGACIGVCPKGALTIDDYPFNYKPQLDGTKCNNCGLCYKVCPGKGYPVVEWSKSSYGGGVTSDKYTGPVLKYLFGQSCDPNICLSGSSGGVATSLMLHLLEHNEDIDAVVVVTLENGVPTVRITDDPKVVISASKSKYSPVPVMKVIRELLDNPRKVAMTVTPCQLAAFKYASKYFKGLEDCLQLSIGLFCRMVVDYDSVSKVAESIGIKYPGEAQFLGWRCGEWPGASKFKLSNGKIKSRESHKWLTISWAFYQLNRCYLCPERKNWLADMALADNHSGKTTDTVIVCRTQRGYDALLAAENDGYIKLRDMPKERANRIAPGSKLLPGLANIEWCKKKGLAVPEYDFDVDSMFEGKSNWERIQPVLRYRKHMFVRNSGLFDLLTSNPKYIDITAKLVYNFPYV